MKYLRKLAAFATAMTLAFSLALTAMAAGPAQNTITIKNSIAGHTYTAWQIFSGTYEENSGKLSDIEWGAGVSDPAALLAALKALPSSPYTACTTAQDVAQVLKNFGDDSAEIDTFAGVAGSYLGTPAGTSVQSGSGSIFFYTITVQGDGYYFVKDTGGLSETEPDAATKYMLQVCGSVSVNAKAEVPTLDKFIVNADSANGSDGKGTAQDVGSEVKFKLTGAVPKMDGYDTYTYIVHDTLSNGLTFRNNVAVTINGAAYNDFTVAVSGQSFTVTFGTTAHPFTEQKTNAGKPIVITYSATLNEGALQTDKETNKVHLEFSNDPQGSTTDCTPERIVHVYDFDIVIDKYTEDLQCGERLAGAKFVLYKKDQNDTKLYYYYDTAAHTVHWNALATGETLEKVLADDYAGTTKVTEVTTDSKGAARFRGIDSGSYFLHETQAPAGYNLLKDDKAVTITAQYKQDGTLFKTSAKSRDCGQYEQTQPIENKAGTLLPSTGGRGTTAMTTAGTALLLVGGALLLARKRRREQAPRA